MTSLYELTQEMKELDDLLAAADDPNDPLIFDAIQRALALQDERERKVDAYCCLIAELAARAAARKAEAQRLAESAAATEAKIKSLKGRLMDSMKTLDIKRIETDRFTVTVANNGGLVPLIVEEGIDPKTLPEPLQKIIVTVNNEAVRAELEAGKSLAFAKLGERGQHLRIK